MNYTRPIQAGILLAALSAAVFAQEQSNPLSGGQKAFYSMVSGNLIAGAEEMPEADFAFKPTPEVRSFGQLVGHVADAQYLFCSIALGEKNPSPGIEKTKTAKADLVQALEQITRELLDLRQFPLAS